MERMPPVMHDSSIRDKPVLSSSKRTSLVSGHHSAPCYGSHSPLLSAGAASSCRVSLGGTEVQCASKDNVGQRNLNLDSSEP